MTASLSYGNIKRVNKLWTSKIHPMLWLRSSSLVQKLRTSLNPKLNFLLCPHTDMFIDCSLIGRIFIDANANKRIRVWICTCGMFESCQDLLPSNLLVGRVPRAGKLTRTSHSYSGFPSLSVRPSKQICAQSRPFEVLFCRGGDRSERLSA